MSMDKAAYLDATNLAQPSGCLRTVTFILQGFKEEYPHIWKELCDRGLMFSDFTLQDSLDGLVAASQEIDKCVEQEQCRI